MGEEYIPKYVDGQILVYFYDRYGESFVRDFVQGIGGELSNKAYLHTKAYVVNVARGKENEMIEAFKGHGSFVESAELRDIKMESRWNELERLIKAVQDLHDNVCISDEKYHRGLDKIFNTIKKKN